MRLEIFFESMSILLEHTRYKNTVHRETCSIARLQCGGGGGNSDDDNDTDKDDASSTMASIVKVKEQTPTSAGHAERRTTDV